VSAVTRIASEDERHPLTAYEAACLADWYTRFALDRAHGGDGRNYHTGFVSHLEAARAQFVAVVELGAPANDQHGGRLGELVPLDVVHPTRAR
jgi:hypothetical protein